jgi:hypothetical protein
MSNAHGDEKSRKSAMGLTCNIDRAGQRARGVVGIVLVVGAGIAFYFGATGEGNAAIGAWIAGVGLLLGGAFCLFEAANGWCAVRAMGFRTKL